MRRELLQTMEESPRNPERVRLREFGALAGEQLVDRAEPQIQPVHEVTFAQPHLRVELGVRTECAPSVGPPAEQDRLPERCDPRDVRVEVELGDVDEDEPDDRVLQRPPVERADEPFAVGAARDVVQPFAHLTTITNPKGASFPRRWLRTASTTASRAS